MAIERTLSIIKPDAVAKNVIGQIYARFEAAGLKIVAAKMVHLSKGEAEAFYAVHKARPFFNDLVNFMISGPVMIQVLEGEGAIEHGESDDRRGDQREGCDQPAHGASLLLLLFVGDLLIGHERAGPFSRMAGC